METVVYNRQKIYGEVWTEPVTTVAKIYGISDVALRKHCKTLLVPLPPRGYWARVNAGGKLKKPKLPKYEGHDNLYVRKNITSQDKKVEGNDILNFLPFEQKEKVYEICKNVKVEEVLERPHFLIKETGKYLKARKRDEYPNKDQVLNLSASKENIDRAFRIMDAILKALEKMGYKIKNKFYETRICIGKEDISIRLREKINRIEHKPTEEEIRKQSKGFYYIPVYDEIPTGEFILSIEEYFQGRKNWRDTETKKLEDKIGEFIIYLIKAGEQIRIRHEEIEERHRKYEEEMVQKNHLQQLRENELKKFNNLSEEAENYKKSIILNEYIVALEKQVENIAHMDEKNKLLEYINWAKEKTDWVNPLINREDKILGKKYNLD